MDNTSQTLEELAVSTRFPKVHNDWRTYLGNTIKKHRETPMKWGEFDCIVWATTCIQATTGKDLYAPFRGKYDSVLGAAKVLLKEAESLSSLCEKYLGEPKHIAFANTGDIVTVGLNRVNQAGEYNVVFNCALGVAYGGLAYFVGEEGLVTYPLLEMDYCYHV